MKFNCVITPAAVRHFPGAPLPEKSLAMIDLALNERFSFQLAMRSEEAVNVVAELEGPKGWSLRVRRVGCVPVAHHNTPVLKNPLDNDGIGYIPGFVPDPLFDENKMLLPQDETAAFWFTVKPADNAKPGKYELVVTLRFVDKDGVELARPRKSRLLAKLHNVKLSPRKDFDVTHWFYNDCLITWYKTDMFDEKYWEVLPAYLNDIVEHGQNVIYVPLITPPLDTDKHPSQLLKVKKAGSKYSFDWSDVRRYIKTARKCGITVFEWSHLFGQWGCRLAPKVYEGQGATGKLLWPADTPATSATYKKFLSCMLPELEKFLREEKILSKSLFHISDEPHGEEAKANYLAAKKMVADIAPWMRCIDAVSQIEFGREKIIDVPVPSISTALDFNKEGIESWCYYCCGPRGEFLNHLMDTPLAKIAMHGFLFYRWPFKGFLHWGFNYWNLCQRRDLLDPFVCSDAKAWPGWAFGDTFLVYPGDKGPIDSVRWEIFSEAMQDYALLQTMGLDRYDKLIADVKSFSDFPKDASWRTVVRAKLLRQADR